MRTTLEIDEDVLLAAKEQARRDRRSVGEVVSELARKGLTGTTPGSGVADPEAFYGFRPFPRRGVIVTNAQIDELREEEDG